MAINHIDGQFGLDCWETEDTSVDAKAEEFSDNRQELRERALLYLKNSRFKVIDLSRWNAANDEWELIDTLTKDDVADMA